MSCTSAQRRRCPPVVRASPPQPQRRCPALLHNGGDVHLLCELHHHIASVNLLHGGDGGCVLHDLLHGESSARRRVEGKEPTNSHRRRKLLRSRESNG
ncbi:Os04g0298550 [Oryza sativa Japonica Group]|uniref:Os04g0298550 protein n=1 Tax=Oryza sativa subsp. japonica TaxID=39947 RepID=A0A0N7KIS8_ORYSJ|nr:Os04g0298550 [Oryza sativa Japonica Group]